MPKPVPPVPDVIIRDDGMAQEAVDARDRITQDCAPQMPDMHFLRNVRTAVIHHDRFRPRHLRNTKTRIPPNVRGPAH